MAVKHTIRTKTGKRTMKLTARRAIIENCKECLGWEVSPRECTSPLCALYPFRTWDKPKNASLNSHIESETI